MEGLGRNLKIISTALNDLAIQLEGLELNQEAGHSVLPSDASENKRTSGYINWNSTHDVLKTEHWMKMSLFTEFCGMLERGAQISFNLHIKMDDKCVVNEETRFPKDDLYMNVSNPLVSAEILYIKELRPPVPGLVDRFLNKAKGEIHTLSSFEMKYGLKWVEPSLGTSSVVKSEPMQDDFPRPVIDNISEPVIPDSWILSDDQKLKEEDSSTEEDLSEDLVTQELTKQFTDILRKLTQNNVDTLLDKVRTLEINNQKQMEVVVDLLFEKALEKPGSSAVYATLARKLSKLKVPSDNKPDKHVNFRGLIIGKCQNHFETAKSDKQVKIENELVETNDPTIKKALQMRLDEQNMITRLRAVANAKFIGELYKLKLLTSKIIDYCLRNLSEELDENKLECLCELITTVGEQFDNEGYPEKRRLDIIFMKMQKFDDLNSGKISRHIQCMVQDVFDLRKRKWAIKNPPIVKALPKTMDEIQEESEKRALLIELMNNFGVGGSGGDGAGDGGEIRYKEDVKQAGKNMYSIDALKLKAADQGTQNYIQLPPESFTKISDDILEKLQADPTSRGDMVTADRDLAPSVTQSNSASVEQSTFNSVETFAPIVAQVPITSKMQSLVKSTVEQFIINPDEEELVVEVKQYFPSRYHAAVVGEILNVALEKNIDEVKIVANLLFQLVATNLIAPEYFVAGLKDTFTHAPDLFIDIPMLYEHLGMILAAHIEKEHITLAQIFDLSEGIISENQGGRLLASIIDSLCEEVEHEFVRRKWDESGLQFSQWMREEQVPEWVYDNDFEFLNFDFSL